MKKTLVAAIALVCTFLGAQLLSAPSMPDAVFHPVPAAWAATSNTPAYTPASSTNSGTAATAPAAQTPADLYPDLGSSVDTATAVCGSAADSGGLIPCGKNVDDPNTSWNECDACDFCAIPLALQLVTDALIKLVGVVTLLAIVLGQLIAMTAIGQTDMMAKIKAVLGSALMGFGYVLAAWVMVNAILSFIGYTNPLGGQWYVAC